MRYGQAAGWICQRHDRETLARLRAWKPDGVLFQVDEFDGELLDHVRQLEIPRVGLRALRGQEDGIPLILPDLAAIGRQIAEHFVLGNYRRIAYLGPRSDLSANAGNTHFGAMRRVAAQHHVEVEGYFPDDRETWEQLGLSFEERSTTGWVRFWELGPSLIDHLLREPEPVALFSAFVEPAMELMEMIDERAIAIPDRIGMAAQTEDALTGSVTMVPLTCIVPDYERQGYEAATLLDRMLSGTRIPKDFRHFIPAKELILRDSSNHIATSDPVVRDMMNHLRRQALNPEFAPDTLAEAFGCSLRLVQLRFREAVGRGVADLIREHRTRHAADLIRSTRVPMQQVVNDSGFTNHHQLNRAIRKSFGMTPTALRQESLRKM